MVHLKFWSLGRYPNQEPRVNEVLIKVVVSTVTAGDCELRRFDIATWIWVPVRLFMGIFKPRIKSLGQEFSGVIEEIGSDVKNCQVGMEIFSTGGMKMGGCGEYVCLPESHPICPKPTNLSLRAAAAISTGGTNAVHFLRKGQVGEGDDVLINDAGGSIGTMSLQISKHLGAKVTCIDKAEKHGMLNSLGADKVIDYRESDFTILDDKYDVIIDIAGITKLNAAFSRLKPNGRLVLGNPTFTSMLWAAWATMTTDKQALVSLAGENQDDNLYLKELTEQGVVKIPIDRSYKLDEIVEAHRYVETGYKQGNVLIIL
ncbi:MAG: NAD(P)-dependent alcohol dehydrogenase [Cyclobacteriaceae bacterium]